jgi:branched-chain amino acid aminotransferase
MKFSRGFLFGDSIFETIKVLDNKVLFLEDHYFRLMASMRICRMEIPMNFTMEYFESQILNLIQMLLVLLIHQVMVQIEYYRHIN